MKYTVVLTHQQNGEFHATVPALPECTVAAETKSEALDALRETISSVVSRSEVLELDVPGAPEAGRAGNGTPWHLFGMFREDLAWGELFDEIERQRDACQ